MASLDLGSYWDHYIASQVESGRYSSASELVQESLRLFEARDLKRKRINDALEAGERSGCAGELNMDEIKEKARLEWRRRNEQTQKVASR